MSGKQPPDAPGVLGRGSGHMPMDKEALLKPLFFPNHQRHFKIFTTVVSTAVAYYMVFHYDFGDKRHCFSWLRELKEQKKREFFSIDPEDRELQVMREKVHRAQEDKHVAKETR